MYSDIVWCLCTVPAVRVARCTTIAYRPTYSLVNICFLFFLYSSFGSFSHRENRGHFRAQPAAAGESLETEAVPANQGHLVYLPHGNFFPLTFSLFVNVDTMVLGLNLWPALGILFKGDKYPT